ncbi:O-antigen translocase [Aquamicrobium sp. LC103]|uniref:O-antigen translocase n=1 Tax=Aquamicrobium sp. LC103 TaxID=1120658 RepID=UPI002484B0E3|nr:O-antigen translocase [Aquamicrobium sp. LC103]
MLAPADASGGRSYLQILRSTAMIGGSSAVNILFAVVRNKAMAVLLGPAGVGLFGLYGAIADLAQTLAGLGVQASGVRQIAEAAGSGETRRVARTAIVLRRISLLLGLLGAALLAAFAVPISGITFGDAQHAAGIVLLSAAVFFRLVSAGQTALIQGMRQIASLTRINMLGALFSTLIAIPMVYFLGTDGVVPSLVAMAAVTLLTSWWYARKIRVEPQPMRPGEIAAEVAPLLKLGFAFMASAFLTVGAAYAVRLIVLRHDGFAAAGLYQAAWALGGIYAGFILQAMGTDFYPRLTAICNDDRACNRLVNEQARVSILLAGPGLIATLTLAPIVMRIFYSAEFEAAVGILRWICLGMMLRIFAWPMGYIVLAKGAQKIFFWTEVAATIVHVGLAWLLVSSIGLTGSGVAFFGLYVWHAVLIYFIVARLSGFRWSGENVRLGLVFLLASALVFSGFLALPGLQALGLGLLMTALTGLYSLRMLLGLVPRDRLPVPLRRWVRETGQVDGGHPP